MDNVYAGRHGQYTDEWIDGHFAQIGKYIQTDRCRKHNIINKDRQEDKCMYFMFYISIHKICLPVLFHPTALNLPKLWPKLFGHPECNRVR